MYLHNIGSRFWLNQITNIGLGFGTYNVIILVYLSSYFFVKICKIYTFDQYFWLEITNNDLQ